MCKVVSSTYKVASSICKVTPSIFQVASSTLQVASSVLQVAPSTSKLLEVEKSAISPLHFTTTTNIYFCVEIVLFDITLCDHDSCDN